MNDEQRKKDEAACQESYDNEFPYGANHYMEDFEMGREVGWELGWEAAIKHAQSEQSEDRGDDLTVAYMTGFEKGKEEIQRALLREAVTRLSEQTKEGGDNG